MTTEARLLRNLAIAIERHDQAVSMVGAPLLALATPMTGNLSREDALSADVLADAVCEIIDTELPMLRRRALAKLAQDVVDARASLNVARADGVVS